ncbi:Six-hairpin glycosidase [Schizopora paradoxa]|uniref:Six-hairpin glycosidase n=1 Tax=Schizopora paradoxa TaxID=27342 RepID=A0A0H2RDP2_9AGAM|nr:Six-hairpin glycosidase [Schizopora paradoxa]
MEQESQIYQQNEHFIEPMREVMLGSIRTSWEQGTAAGAVTELDDSEYSVFSQNPFQSNGTLPAATLRLALSAVVRQTSDGRLSQDIGDATDDAALDGASAGPAVLLGTYTEPSRTDYWWNAAANQINYLLYTAPRTSTGAISHRSDAKAYWSDGVYMGFPFIAMYGAVSQNQTLLQIAYDQCRLYRNALLVNTPNGNLWAHIFNDDTGQFDDAGTWATGNAWAALGMIRVQAIISKTNFASSMASQMNDLSVWVKEILDGSFRQLTSNNLLPDYFTNGPNNNDSSSAAALASVAYRAAAMNPSMFGTNYTDIAGLLRDAVFSGIDDLGVLSPVVDPLNAAAIGTLSTEAQAFGLMMMAAWRDWIGQ